MAEGKAQKTKQGCAAGCGLMILCFFGYAIFLGVTKTTSDKPDAPSGATAIHAETTPIFVSIQLPQVFQGKSVEATTNLPDGTQMQGSLQPPAPACQPNCGYVWEATFTAKNGHFTIGPFQVAPGTYTLEITTPIASLQPAAVQTIIGPNGENLQGPLIKAELVAGVGPTVEYTVSINIPDENSASPSAASETPPSNTARLDIPTAENVSPQESARQQELDYIKHAQWRVIQADNGMRYEIDIGSIHHLTNGAITINFVRFESNAPTVAISPMDIQQFIFDCQGRYQIIDGSSGPVQFAPYNSIAGKIGALACKSASNSSP